MSGVRSKWQPGPDGTGTIGAAGFEPAVVGTKTRCLTNLATPQRAASIKKIPAALSTARRSAVLALAILTVSGALTACKPRLGTPEDTLRAFLTEVKARRGREAWTLLSRSSQDALLGDARALAEASGAAPETDPQRLLFERTELLVLRGTEAITLASRPGDQVQLRVALPSGKGATIHMVREGEAWRVDLVGSMAPIPTSTTDTSTTGKGAATSSTSTTAG
jgi:hypothetical protein